MKTVLLYGLAQSALAKAAANTVLTAITDDDLLVIADGPEKPDSRYSYQELSQLVINSEMGRSQFIKRSTLTLNPLSLCNQQHEFWKESLNKLLFDEKFDLVILMGREKNSEKFQNQVSNLIAYTQTHTTDKTRFIVVASDYISESLLDYRLNREVVMIPRKFRSNELDALKPVKAAIYKALKS